MKPPRTYATLPSKAARALYALVMEKGGPQRIAITKALGVSHTTIGNWFKGRCVPKLETALAIKRLYGIPVKDWFVPDPERGDDG